jgi:hypothetical protein
MRSPSATGIGTLAATGVSLSLTVVPLVEPGSTSEYDPSG